MASQPSGGDKTVKKITRLVKTEPFFGPLAGKPEASRFGNDAAYGMAAFGPDPEHGRCVHIDGSIAPKKHRKSLEVGRNQSIHKERYNK